jgi:hypothetical protein
MRAGLHALLNEHPTHRIGNSTVLRSAQGSLSFSNEGDTANETSSEPPEAGGSEQERSRDAPAMWSV